MGWSPQVRQVQALDQACPTASRAHPGEREASWAVSGAIAQRKLVEQRKMPGAEDCVVTAPQMAVGRSRCTRDVACPSERTPSLPVALTDMVVILSTMESFSSISTWIQVWRR